MDISLIFNIIFFTTTFLFGIWKVVDNKKEKKREEERRQYKEDLKNHLETGKGWVDALHEKTSCDQKYNTQQFAALKDTDNALEKRIRVLEAQQVSREVVKVMLDDKVDPLDKTVEKLADDMSKGFKEIRDNQVLTEMATNQIMVTLSRLEGKLEGSGVIKPRRDVD